MALSTVVLGTSPANWSCFLQWAAWTQHKLFLLISLRLAPTIYTIHILFGTSSEWPSMTVHLKIHLVCKWYHLVLEQISFFQNRVLQRGILQGLQIENENRRVMHYVLSKCMHRENNNSPTGSDESVMMMSNWPWCSSRNVTPSWMWTWTLGSEKPTDMPGKNSLLRAITLWDKQTHDTEIEISEKRRVEKVDNE